MAAATRGEVMRPLACRLSIRAALVLPEERQAMVRRTEEVERADAAGLEVAKPILVVVKRVKRGGDMRDMVKMRAARMSFCCENVFGDWKFDKLLMSCELGECRYRQVESG